MTTMQSPINFIIINKKAKITISPNSIAGFNNTVKQLIHKTTARELLYGLPCDIVSNLRI